MHNWGVNLSQLKKAPEAYRVWRLEQLINYGLEGEKLDKKQLKKYWPKLRLDSAKAKYLEFLLWAKKS